jgi:tetratricopeptide (TPR) repeat protein
VLGRLLKRLLGRTRGDAKPPPEPVWLSSARASIANGQVGAAIGLLTPRAAGSDAAFEALHLLGQALGMSGRFAEARAVLMRGVATRDGAGIRADLGNVLQLSGDPAAAAEEYRRSLALDRAQPAVWCNLGLALAARGDASEAAACLDEALSRDRTLAAALGAYAALAPRGAGLWERFERHVQRALAANPDSAVALEAQGFIFLKRDLDAGRAAGFFERAIRAGGDRADLFGNYGIALQDLGRVEEAIAAYDRAIGRDPAHVFARWHRSLALLLVGRFAEAWPDYDLRLRSEDVPQRVFPVARWDGRSTPSGLLLLAAEQGLGDEIMFASCIPDVLALGARCVVECHAKLAPIFRRSFPEATIRAGSQLDDSTWLRDYPDLAAYVPLGSLPQRFRRSSADFPSHRGYLRADPAKVAAWRSRLAALGPGRKVGISWRGGTAKTRRKLRSPAPEELAGMLRTPNTHWVSLQYDATPAEIDALAATTGAAAHHWPEAIDDYDETAALLCALDLTVSVCTAVIHLGGALGRPVWVMAPYSPEWRYGLYWERMPWYPSVRVLRQASPGAWGGLLQRVTNELAAYAPPL